MMEPLKKTLLAGLGGVAFTKEKLEKIFEELVERGELTKEQGKNILKVLVERGDAEGKNLVEKIAKETERWLSRGPLATRGELRSLETRVAELEGRLGVSADARQDDGSASAVDSVSETP